MLSRKGVESESVSDRWPLQVGRGRVKEVEAGVGQRKKEEKRKETKKKRKGLSERGWWRREKKRIEGWEREGVRLWLDVITG